MNTGTIARMNAYGVGSKVQFLIADAVRKVTPGMTGVIVESFAPLEGRNVQLADGRTVNVSVEELSATASPATTLTAITLLVRYEWSTNLYQHVCIIDGAFTVEATVASWMKSDRAELVDWCVSEYAPIPF